MVNALVDLLNAPGVVPLQHVVETFDGDTLDERWNVTGSGSVTMNDAENGGIVIATSTSQFTEQSISFNNINHYSNTASSFIIEIKRISATNCITFGGLCEIKVNSRDTTINYRENSGSTYKQLETGTNASRTNTNTSIVTNTDWTKVKGDLKTSSATLHINDILEAVSVDNLPDVAMQPFIITKVGGESVVKESYVRYLEAFNT